MKKSILVMGYEAYETLTNVMKLDSFGEKVKNCILNALVDPGKHYYIKDNNEILKNL